MNNKGRTLVILSPVQFDNLIKGVSTFFGPDPVDLKKQLLLFAGIIKTGSNKKLKKDGNFSYLELNVESVNKANLPIYILSPYNVPIAKIEYKGGHIYIQLNHGFIEQEVKEVINSTTKLNNIIHVARFPRPDLFSNTNNLLRPNINKSKLKQQVNGSVNKYLRNMKMKELDYRVKRGNNTHSVIYNDSPININRVNRTKNTIIKVNK